MLQCLQFVLQLYLEEYKLLQKCPEFHVERENMKWVHYCINEYTRLY